MSNICDFDRILKTECNLQHFARNCRIKNLDDFERDEADAYLRRAGIQREGERNHHMLHYEQEFGNDFGRRESKCCVVLMKHHRNVKSEQVINLQMAKQLKTKNINAVPGELFYRQCTAKFSLETDTLFDDQDKVQSVADTDNEFTEFQTPRKKLQSIGISPASLNASMETLKSDVLEASKLQVDCLKTQSLILTIKMI